MKLTEKKFEILVIWVLVALVTAGVSFGYFLSGEESERKIKWGVDFSQMQAEYFGLDWKKLYSSIIEDLGSENIKIHVQWDFIEGKKAEYFFDDVDWQIKKAEENGVKIIYVLGMKTGRWPECHIPSWAENLPEEKQKLEILKYITETVLRYRDSKAVAAWQVENEPLFKFGVCPAWYYQNADFLKKKVELVKSLDPSRKIIISDSGEQSDWIQAAQIGDVVGTTIYRKAWPELEKLGVNPYLFLSSASYSKKAQLISDIFGRKVVCVELQAEPWASKPLMDAPIDEQLKSMNAEILSENIKFAKETGFDEFYLWGVEWWFWMKEKQNHPEIWEEAKKLFDRP